MPTSELDKRISALPLANAATIDQATSIIPVVVGGITSYLTLLGLIARVGAEGAIGEANTSSSVGTGESVVKPKVGVTLPFKSIKAGAGIAVTSAADEITIASTGGAGESNTASNVGAGAQVFKAKTLVDLAFRSLVAGTNVTLTQNANDVTINASGGSGSFTGGDVPNPIKVWRSAGPSTRVLDAPAFRVADTSGVAYRAFAVYGDEGVVHVGPTPSAVQWPSGASPAPAGSKGPTANLDPQSGVFLFNGPTGGSVQQYFVSNAVINSTYGGGADGGPARQANIGLVGANSTGRIRIHYMEASSDGGLRVLGNRYAGQERSATGTVARLTLDTLTFDSPATLAQVEIGENVWVDVGGTIYGYTLRHKPTTTTALIPSVDSGGTWTARAFTIRGAPQADTNRGSLKYGTDSSGNVWGVNYGQPKDSATMPYFATVSSYIKDFHFLIYPGGYGTEHTDGQSTNMAFGRFTDIGTNGAGRGLRFFTSKNDANDDFRAAITCYDHYGVAPTVEMGELRLTGTGTSAGFQLPVFAGYAGTLINGNLYVDGSDLKVRIGGVTKTVTLT